MQLYSIEKKTKNVLRDFYHYVIGTCQSTVMRFNNSFDPFILKIKKELFFLQNIF